MTTLIAAAMILVAQASDVSPEIEGTDSQPDEENALSVPYSAILDQLAMCESSGRWNANTGNGYYGGLQMDMTFWRRHGGMDYASRPDLASRAAQIEVAVRGQAVQGWGAWPRCSRIIGLR